MVKIVSLAHPINIFEFGWKTKKLQISLKFWPFSGLISAGPRSYCNKPRPKLFDYKGSIWYPLGRVKLALKLILIDSPYSLCIAFWPIRLLPTTFCSQNKISLPYLMISILLHKLKLNEKRCLLNKSCSILCPNDGNISLVYGGSFVGYLQRDNCAEKKIILCI